MVYDIYSHKLLELKKQKDSGSITNEAYLQKLDAIKKECAQSEEKVAINYDERSYSRPNDVPKFENDMDLIKYLESLTGYAPKRHPQKEGAKTCQTNTSS